MLRRITLAAFAAVTALAAGLPFPVVGGSKPSVSELSGPGEPVVVERVLDGDTVSVRGRRERVRLANIDAPEMSHGYGKPGQPFSVQSTKWLTEQVEGKPGVSMRCVDQDRYGRSVCDLYRNGSHVNKELVRAGLAWAYTANKRYLRDRTVLDAQEEARAAHRGLWAQPKPVPPWDWRHSCWDGAVCAP